MKFIHYGLLTVFLLGMAASGGGGTPSDPMALILGDANSIYIENLNALMSAGEIPGDLLDTYGAVDTDEFQDSFADYWGDSGHNLGIAVEEVSQSILVRTSAGSYHIIKGKFDFAELQNELEDDDYEQDSYRDLETWQNERSAVALFPDSSSYVYGSVNLVKDVLKAVDKGEGFIDGSPDFKRLIDKLEPNALLSAVVGDCSGLEGPTPGGCQALAMNITDGDEETTFTTTHVLFSSERRAESGLDDVEDGFEDSERNIDVDEIEASGDIVTIKTTSYE